MDKLDVGKCVTKLRKKEIILHIKELQQVNKNAIILLQKG